MARICHISVLNPAKHSRIFYKLALSQVKFGHEVSILAQVSIGKDPGGFQNLRGLPSTYKDSGVNIHPIQPFKRLSLRRIFFSFWIANKALNQQANIYTIHAPELFGLAFFLKKRTGAKIIYDVHEDYRLNILNGKHYPAWLRKTLANTVRWAENRAMKWIDGVTYAEEIYAGMFEVESGKTIILRNKFTDNVLLSKPNIEIPQMPYMLFSGTIGEDLGVISTLDLWEAINQLRPLHLVVVGHSQQPKLLKRIQQRVDESGIQDRFTLIGGSSYVPNSNIIELIRNCWFGTLLYQPKPHIRGKISTKFYEYLACDKPLVFTNESIWNAFHERVNLGISYRKGDSIPDLLNELERLSKNLVKHERSDYHWETEEVALERMLGDLVL